MRHSNLLKPETILQNLGLLRCYFLEVQISGINRVKIGDSSNLIALV
ncbi:hypothetical protein FDUTEX481_00690 [Tolypothrix sp. PCC 7601]|nr:hypothetical protein FDUTEX481_00690 [Tolypothrix sp. PCC 7601]